MILKVMEFFSESWTNSQMSQKNFIRLIKSMFENIKCGIGGRGFVCADAGGCGVEVQNHRKHADIILECSLN